MTDDPKPRARDEGKAERPQQSKTDLARDKAKPPPDDTTEGEGSPGLNIDFGGGHA